MGVLADLGLVQSSASLSARLFEHLIPDFLDIRNRESPNVYMNRCWSAYQQNYPNENVGTNGKFFELCVATVLVRESILPIYVQAQVAFVPNVEYDFILYTAESGPICISTKTTLRERWKQADLEAVALKYVHRRAESYLINISEDENRILQGKIAAGGVMGLDDSVFAFSEHFNRFIQQLKEKDLVLAPEVKVVTSQAIVTRESVHGLRDEDR